jgi:crotonobetainyl-CoA:carnitine CoA-transferase CaiB-like acyl-CoA transferase
MSSALQGIKVIDLSRILAGPWASQLLADMGAEVIKVEQPIKGDDTRFWGPPFIKRTTKDQPPQAAYFHCANRNKQSIAIDITQSKGQQVIKDLVANADVFLENFKVGGLAKYGLDYQSLQKINPKLVYCSITGFGQTGPSANKAGYDAMIQGEGGLMSITGEPEGMPMKVGVAVVDVMTGLYSSNAILAALMARHHTHQGQHIDIALLDVQLAMLANQGMNYLSTKENPQRRGNGHPTIVPYQCFATQDSNIILAVGNNKQFQRFCDVANLKELSTDKRFSTNEQRVINRNKLIPVIAEKLARFSTSWWLETLEKSAVPCGSVNTVEQAINHPQIQHRKMIKDIPNSDGQIIKTIASPIHLSETPLQYRRSAPNLGQDSQNILSVTLGYSASDIKQLFSENIVG